MKISRFIAILLFCYTPMAHAASLQDWQGEWGSWKLEGDRYHGASISIFHCDDATSSCSLRFDSERDINSRCGFGTNEGTQLKISPSGEGVAEFADPDGDPVRCVLSIKMEINGSSRQLRVAHSGNNCGYYCTGEVNIPEAYPLNSTQTFPAKFSRECFGDLRKSRQTFCRSTELQKLEDDVFETGQDIDHLNQNDEMWKTVPQLRESILTECADAQDVAGCMKAAYQKDQAKLDQQKQEAEEVRQAREKALATPGDPKQASALIGQIEGVYKEHFDNGLIDGTGYTSEDILELVRVTDDTLYFRTHLEFYNGHICEIYGLARYTQAGTFVHNEPPLLDEDPPCQLQIQVNGKEISFVDPGGTCNPGHCGMRGSLSGEGFARSAHRTIRYMTILKNSQEYKDSVATIEIKTGQQTQE